MAKTAKGKAPAKKCAKCGKENHARSAKCKYCEAPFPPPKPKAKRQTKSVAPPDTLTAAIGLVKAAGGFDRAKAILDELEQVKGL